MDIACSNILSDVSPEARETKEKNKQIGLYQTKNFCTAKETINKIKKKPTEKVSIFANISDKGLISKISKELTKLNIKKQTT